jgi:cell division protein ZapA (FtsZ GTPase activity inhibitor)
VVLQIAGQRLRLNANTDESHLERLAQFVNERCEAMQRATKNAVPATLLALVALDLADELHTAWCKTEQAREEARRAVADAEARATEIEQTARRAVAEAIAEIDHALESDDVLSRKDGASETA